MARAIVGTIRGLYELDLAIPRSTAPPLPSTLEGQDVVALAAEGRKLWALVAGSVLQREGDGSWEQVASAEGHRVTCLLPTSVGLLVGTAGAHLLRVEGREAVLMESFERVGARSNWYTPWGGPPDTRSMSSDPSGRIYVNVHVGGIPRSTDGGRGWEPTIDIDADVHQVLAHHEREDVILAATARGLAASEDGGSSWDFHTRGLHSTYSRAVAVAGESVFLSASRGPRGGEAAIYRAGLGSGMSFERCGHGLPEWFEGNIDTGWIGAAGGTIAFASSDGSVFASTDGGDRWEQLARKLPSVRCLLIALTRR